MAGRDKLQAPGGYGRNSVAAGTDTIADDYVFVLAREVGLKGVQVQDLTNSRNRTVRRPFGLEFKKDSYAYIEVLREDDREGSTKLVPILLFNENHPGYIDPTGSYRQSEQGVANWRSRERPDDSSTRMAGAGLAPYTNNFLIQSSNEAREEKFQLIETFGDNFLFLFGERPRFLDISGILMNSNSHRWKREWWLNYDRFLRGTRCVENKAIVTLHVDGVAVSGYILSAASGESSQSPRMLQFSFRMIVTDYVFEDAPIDTANFFAENLFKNRGYGTDDVTRKSVNSLSEAFGRAADTIGTGMDFAGGILSNAILTAAVSSITQAVFGNPLAGITNGLAAGANVMETLMNNDLNLGDLEEFRSGLGSIVEFQGVPIEAVPINGGTTTLQEQGVANLLASIDNSLSILLNLSRSPVIQSVTVLGSLIEGAISSLGGSSLSFATNARQKYTDFLGRADKNVADGTIITGRFMGFDFTMPFRGLDSIAVNPAPQAVVNTSAGAPVDQAAAAGVFGSPRNYEFSTLGTPTGSDIDFDQLKKDPVTREAYLRLPRTWRLNIEKDPARMSEKLLVNARRNTDGDVTVLLRKRKRTVPIEATVTKRLVP